VTRVDFYVLPDAVNAGRERFACRLADIAFRRGQRVYVYAQSREQAAALDTLLWTFQAGSFIPHCIHPADNKDNSPVLIGHDGVPEQGHDVLINLADTVPSFFSRFERVTEVVNQDQTVKDQGRQKFRYYRDRGYALETHTMAAQTDNA